MACTPSGAFKSGQYRRPFVGRNEAGDMAGSGNVVAEQDDDVGVQRIGAFDNAGMRSIDIQDRRREGRHGGDPRWNRPPSRRRQLVARDAEPDDGLR